MSLIDIKGKWDLAIDGKGYMLRGTPESPRYRKTQATLFNPRYAQGDRSYEDISQFWFNRQTDWYQGFKDDQSWADDGKFYFSTNIDTYTNPGEIKCAKGHTDIYTFTSKLTCGADGLVSADSGKFVGTYDSSATDYPRVYQETDPTYTDIGPTLNNEREYISTLFLKDSILWMGTSGELTSGSGDSTGTIEYYDGVTWVECSNEIHYLVPMGTSGNERVKKCLCFSTYNNILYAGICTANKENSETDKRWHIVKTAVAKPTVEGDWEYIAWGHKMEIISLIVYGGNLYYLLYDPATSKAELWQYNLSTDVKTQVMSFQNTNYNNKYAGDRYLFELNGKLIVTVPDSEVWEWDGSSMVRIFQRNNTKEGIGWDSKISLYYGGLIVEGRIHWVNLVYDGFNFHNWIKDNYDSNIDFIVPLFTSTDGKWYGTGTSTANNGVMFSLGAASYKGTDGKNYLVLNNLDFIVGVDKTAYFVDIMFDKLNSGEKIEVFYTNDELNSATTWTSLGSASYTVDGGSVIQKRLFFPDNYKFRKIWFKISLSDATGDTTAVVKDFVLAYLPSPNEEAIWTITINSSDYQLDYQGEANTKPGREINSDLWQLLRNRQVVYYQDVDYASTTLASNVATTDTTLTVTDTSEFPESGRLMIGDVLYYYTGKTQTTFTGVTQGKKDTTAIAQTSGTTVHNGYKVRLQSIDTYMPTSYNTDERQNEYDTQIVLREVL